MSFTAYPEYKKLTFQALGCIPGHWSVVRFKQVYQEINERSEIGAEELLSVSEYYGVKPRSEKIQDGEHLTRAESLEGYKKCKPGDLVMNIMLAWKRGLGISNYVGIVSPAYAVFRNITRAEPRYFHYLLRTDEYIGYFKAYSAGVIDSRLRLYPEVFSRLVAITPPLGEQTQIARFLDHETAKIDALIAEQKRLIKLLQEKRQAVISHAVTKGLDPNVPMKDSGVEWLGEVPAHWEVSKFKWKVSSASGGTPSTSNFERYYNGSIPWLRTTDLNNDVLFEAEVYVTEKAVEETSCRLVPKKSVLIAMYGGDGTIGKHSLLMFNSAINQAVCALLPNPHLLPEYLHAYVEFYRPHWMVGAESSRKDPNIGQDRIGDHYALLPPSSEQVLIVNKVADLKSQYDQLCNEATKSIEYLKERRSALISAAVTGKIDVRDWQPPANESAFDEDVRKAGLEASA